MNRGSVVANAKNAHIAAVALERGYCTPAQGSAAIKDATRAILEISGEWPISEEHLRVVPREARAMEEILP